MSEPNTASSRAPGRSSSRNRLFGVVIPLLAGSLALALGCVTLPAAPAAAEPAMQVRALATGHPAALHPRIKAAHDHPAVPSAPAIPTWSVAITAIGLQAEIDACQWVRMDFSAAVTIPVVAAHNFCGGDIVLQMQSGQAVSLSGAGLDGSYVVVAARDAQADQDAVDAISGLAGDVILQTCYWADDGSERLVALQRVG